MSLDSGMLDGDKQYYIINAGTDREERFRRVTGPLGRWDKDGLIPWAGGLAGKGAFDELPSLVNAMLEPECGRTYGRCATEHDWNVKCPDCRCRVCRPCLVRWMRDRHEAESHRRSDEGTRVHILVGHWASTGVWLVPDPDIAVYVESFKRWVAAFGLQPSDFELLEARVLNRTHRYAGTLDAALWLTRGRSKEMDDELDRLTQDGQPRVQKALVLIDYKSRENEGRQLYLEQPLQLAGYRYGETLRLKDGTEIPMVAVDACAIVQIRPDGTSFELVLAEEPEFATFLSLLAADEWALERGKRAIGARTFKYAPSIVKMRAADSRRVRSEAKRNPVPEETLGEPAQSPGGVKLDIRTDGAVVIEATIEAPPDDSSAARGARAAAAARGAHARTGHILRELRDSHAGVPQGRERASQPEEPPF